jgi:hypothetical protein
MSSVILLGSSYLLVLSTNCVGISRRYLRGIKEIDILALIDQVELMECAFRSAHKHMLAKNG